MYNGTSASWWGRALKRAPRNDLSQLIQCTFLSNCAGTIVLSAFK